MREGVKIWKTINLCNEGIGKRIASSETFIEITERESHDGTFRPYEFLNGKRHYNGTYSLCRKCICEREFKCYDELFGFIDEYTKDGDAIEIVNTAWNNYEVSKMLEDYLREKYKDRLVLSKMEELENYYDTNKDMLNKVCKWLKDNAHNYASEGIDTEKMIKELKEAIEK